MVYLQQLSTTDGTNFYDMLQRIEKEVFAMHNVVNGASYQEYQTWLCQMDDWANQKNLPEGYVKQVTFWLMNNDIPVGYARLRYQLNEKSREYGGSFGYAIDPIYRKQGFGTQLIKLLLERAKMDGISEMLAMVDKQNIASNLIMTKCGGKFVRENTIYNYYTFW